MTYLEFQTLIEEDEKFESAERRFELVLDHDFKVYYDDEECTYWYYNKNTKEVIEVEHVGQLTYKEGFEPSTGCAEYYGFDNPLDYLKTFVESICCGFQIGGKDILWFDVIHDEDDEY